jgi:hypothetical protein
MNPTPPISPTRPIQPISYVSASGQAPQSDLARRLTKVANPVGAPAAFPSASSRVSTPLSTPLLTQTASGSRIALANKLPLKPDECKSFYTAYSTNAGAKWINAITRGNAHSISPQSILNELERTHGEDFYSLKKTNPNLKSDISTLISTLQTKEGRQRIAKGLYDLGLTKQTSPATIFRGQGMTKEGYGKLFDLWKAQTPFRPTHFLSCDTDRSVADTFADQASQRGEKPVLFKIQGKSNMALRPHILVKGETEKLFSPYATFSIEKMYISAQTKQTVVELREIDPTKNAVTMPY